MGAQRLMFISGTRSATSAAAQATRAALGPLIVCEAGGVPQHSGIDIVEAIAARAREHRIDGFVAVGGGSASDSAKAAAILLGEGGKLRDHAIVFSPPDRYVQLGVPRRLRDTGLDKALLPRLAKGAMADAGCISTPGWRTKPTSSACWRPRGEHRDP